MPDTPNPGSDKAIALGCKCPRIDNNRGLRAPWPPDGWYVAEGCPVHEFPAAAPDPEAAL